MRSYSNQDNIKYWQEMIEKIKANSPEISGRFSSSFNQQDKILYCQNKIKSIEENCHYIVRWNQDGSTFSFKE